MGLALALAAKTPRHKVFVSHHDVDWEYKRRFVQMMGELITDVSVDEDDIDDTDLETETIRQEIRDKHIHQASVTVVLIGPCTWQRMHVDWEIHSSIRATDYNSRCGLLGIFLPEHSDYGANGYSPRLMPARLADNIEGEDPYAELYDWPRKRLGRRFEVQQWIIEAFERRGGAPPDASRDLLENNIGGRCSDGW